MAVQWTVSGGSSAQAAFDMVGLLLCGYGDSGGVCRAAVLLPGGPPLAAAVHGLLFAGKQLLGRGMWDLL